MTAPLLLLPLRLEYRVVDAQRPHRVATGDAVAGSGQLDRPFTLEDVPLENGPQIWFRWYFDEGFAERGIAPATAGEEPALAEFEAAIGARAWWDADDSIVAAAWSRLAVAIGAARAVHLLRNSPADNDWQERLGHLPVLPEHVALFALTASGEATTLGRGAPISPDLRYTPEALAPGGFLVDFDRAVAAGLGLQLIEAPLVDTALRSQWLVAVGVHAGDAGSGIERLVRDGVANGTFGFLEQDMPTNNSTLGRPPDIDGRGDPITFLRAATGHETAADPPAGLSSADLLAEALAIDPEPLRRAMGAGDTALADARAMMRAVGPALLDAVADAVPSLSSVDDDDVVELLARDVVARGVLPVVRFGRNPYGVLPLTDIARLDPLAEQESAERTISRMLADYAAAYLRSEAPYALEAVTRIEPGEVALADKLDVILAQMPTSRRLFVSDAGSAEPKPLSCPYVRGPGFEPTDYLETLRTGALSDLADPTEAQTGPPLLYRLARIAIIKNITLPLYELTTGERPTLRARVLRSRGRSPRISASEGSAALEVNALAGLADRRAWPAEVPAALRDRLVRRSAAVAAALQHLGRVAQLPDGMARLEVLLMETIDVIAHRADAWMSGLAHRHLLTRRAAGERGLRAGWWGLLERPGSGPPTATGGGYLQAPSLAQAATAAMLHAGHQRLRAERAFDIDLTSRRVRQAMRLISLLQRGMAPSQALGLRAQRYLHNRGRGDLVVALRDNLPPRDPDTDEPLAARAVDGLAFINDELAFAAEADRPLLAEVQRLLAGDLDALADLVMCEATHLRAGGAYAAANAWLGVLSGEPVPGEPTFIRTIRSGHGSTHRVVVEFDPVSVENMGAAAPPRALAEPAVAAAAARLLPAARAAVVDLVVSGAAVPVRLRLRLGEDLGMTAIDLVVGGESEITVRARHALLRRWRTDQSISDALGALPTSDPGRFLTETRPVSLDLGVGAAPVWGLLERAGELRRLLADGRALDVPDLNAAASPIQRLDPNARLEALRPAREELRRRVTRLAAALATNLESLRSAVDDALRHARAGAVAELTAAHGRLDAALVTAAGYSEPDALRPFTTSELAAAPDLFEATFGELAARLSRRATTLGEALAATATEPSTGVGIDEQVNTLLAGLRAALDGAALTVLPPLGRVGATTPLVEPPSTPAAALGAWAGARHRVGRAVRVATDFGGYRAFAFSAAATDDETGDPGADARDDAVAPRTRLFGAVLARAIGTPLHVGVVADEWSEFRPSRRQQTGLAINYDAPQSEPPHCLLLCEPPTSDFPEWTDDSAVAMVAQAIRWMMVRALPARARRLPGPLLPYANLVSHKPTPSGTVRRLPAGRFRVAVDLLTSFGPSEYFLVEDGSGPVGAEAVGLHEINGFGSASIEET